MAGAQDASSAPSPGVGPSDMDVTIRRVEAMEGLDPELKTQILEAYRTAQDLRAKAKEHAAAAGEYTAVARSAPELLQESRERALPQEPAEASVDSEAWTGMSLEALERALVQARSALGLEVEKLEALRKRSETAAATPVKARQRLAEVQRELEELQATDQAVVPADQPELLSEALGTVRQARTAALEAEQRMLNQQIVTHPVRLELLDAQRESQAAAVDRARERVRALEAIVNQRRLSEAEAAQAAAEAARRESAGKHPLLDEFAERNAQLGREVRDVAAKLERVTAAVGDATVQVARLQEDFDGAKQKIEVAGLSQALGQALRERQRSLPDVRKLRKESRSLEELIGEASLELIRHREERRDLRSVAETVERMLADLPEAEAEAIRPELNRLLRARLELLDKAIATQDAYVRALTDLDFNQRRLIDITEAYDEFLGERLLWVRSTKPLGMAMLEDLPQQIGELLSPVNWWGVLTTLGHEAVTSPLWILPILVFALLMLRRRPLLGALAATGERVGKPTTDSLAYTWQALFFTLLAALPWPLLVLSLGYALRLSTEATDFAKAVGAGLAWLPLQIFFLESFRALCHPKGLGALHFRWPAESLRYLRRRILELITVLVPASFLTVLLFNYFHFGVTAIFSFVVVELAIAWFFFRVLNPKGPVLENFVRRNPSQLLVKSRMLWFPLSFLLPLVFAGYAAAGYVYTSGMLTSRMLQSMWFVLALVVVHAIAVRWLLLVRRRLAYRAAVERREAMLKAAAAEQTDGSRSEVGDLRADVEMPQIDLAALDMNTRKLLSLGIVLTGLAGGFAIWSSVLPALGILDTVELWQQTITVDGQPVSDPITLQDIGIAALIGLATAVLARSLPTFVELVLLHRVAISPGSRYAITTLMGYTIAAIGVIWAFNVIGADWSKLQWLVAALGVGIGFGLQEIVANFISGLIILFERPIRVGDVVTVGDTDGVVTRIQIRATTIRNWDKKELLVPNKEFITGRLLNWSLSDQVNRLVIQVGIAYGSNVELALRLLQEVARENPQVIDDPAPLVTLEAFGDSALNLILRCYLDSLDSRLTTISDLNRAIVAKFAAAGITIPFPQRDVHLDTSKPLEVQLRRGRPTPSGAQP